MSTDHFEQYKSGQKAWLTNHLAGLLRWAKKENPELLESPHDLFSYWIQNAVLPPSVVTKAHNDIKFVAACHHFLDEYAERADFYPDLPEFSPNWGGPRGISHEQRDFLLRLIDQLPADHYAKKLDVGKLSSHDAGQWIDRLKHVARRSA